MASVDGWQSGEVTRRKASVKALSGRRPIGHLADRIEQLGIGRSSRWLAVHQARLAVRSTDQLSPSIDAVEEARPLATQRFHGAVIERVGGLQHCDHGRLLRRPWFTSAVMAAPVVRLLSPQAAALGPHQVQGAGLTCYQPVLQGRTPQ